MHSYAGNHDESKKDFAHSIYYSSRCYGAESIVSSIGYYRLGVRRLFRTLRQSFNWPNYPSYLSYFFFWKSRMRF